MESRRDFFVAQVILDVEKIKLLDVGRVGDVFFFFFSGMEIGTFGIWMWDSGTQSLDVEVEAVVVDGIDWDFLMEK